jgi:hypothetical protein
MADNNDELARLLASQDHPVSPMERELAARNRKLGQPTQPSPDLVSTLAGTGGVGSDARFPVSPVVRDPRMERQIQVRTMSGREPTPEQRAYLSMVAPEKEERSERLSALGAEASMIPQAMRAGSAIGDAAQDPTLANVTNAGVQTAFTALRPLAAAKILGAGYAGAAAQQSGLFDTSAEAQSKKGGAPKVVLPGLTQEQQSFYDAAEKRLREDDFGSSSDRRQVQQQMQELRTLSNDFVRDNAASERRLQEKTKSDAQAEYTRQVADSEAAFKDEMSRNKRFDRTPIGEMYEKTGGYAPFVAGTAAGALFRAGAGPNSLMTKYVVPTAAGAVAGAFAPNAPSYYNSTHTPPDNPKKRAYEARAEALPPEHPRRQEFFDYAKSLPEANPVREAALKDMTLVNILARSGMGAAEGAIGGFGGGDMINVMGRSGSAIGGLASRAQSLWERGGPQKTSATSPEAGAGIPSGAGALSPMPTAGGSSSGPTRHPAATGPSEELVRTLAQGQLPSSAVAANSDDLLRALANPANRNVPKSAEVRRGKDKLGRTFAKDPDDGRFTSDPDK